MSLRTSQRTENGQALSLMIISLTFSIVSAAFVIGYVASYFSRITSNAYSEADYNIVKLASLLLTSIALGPVLQFSPRSWQITLALALTLLVLAIFVPMLLRQRKSYMRPGAAYYTPFMVRY